MNLDGVVDRLHKIKPTLKRSDIVVQAADIHVHYGVSPCVVELYLTAQYQGTCDKSFISWYLDKQDKP